MPPLRVTITQGDIEGCTRKTQTGFEHNCYLGIPYAKPAIGELRFRDPIPHEGWKGVRKATVEGSRMIQIDNIYSEELLGDEDGLFLNVHTPVDAHEGSNLPVMVWFHPGAFSMGSANDSLYEPDYLLEKNIVYVAFNFRLGALGFLCLNTPEVPGNAGLKDQQLALRWVQQNIEKFGGDRNNVTLFGESAGSPCVQLHVLSEGSKGLFHKAIMQSGSCLSKWTIQRNPEDAALALARNLGFNGNARCELLKFLRSIPADEIIKEASANFEYPHELALVPVIEQVHPNVEGFITTPSLQILETGKFNKVPIIIGFCSQEGLEFVTTDTYGETDVSKFNTIKDFGVDIKKFAPENIRAQGSDVVKSFVDKITELYFKKGRHIVDGYVDLMGDVSVMLDIDTSVKLIGAQNYPTYYYKFSYNSKFNIMKRFIKYEYEGACHGDDLCYIFKSDLKKGMRSNDYEDIEPNPSDILTIERMVQMWTNFAKFGDPTKRLTDAVTTKWLPVTKDQLNCLEIGTQLKMISNPNADRIKFWNELKNAKFYD